MNTKSSPSVGPRQLRLGLAMVLVLVASTLLTASMCAQTYRVIYRFSGPDGEFPQTRLHLDQRGNIYGTALDGGSGSDGTIFEMNVRNDNIFSFSGPSGSSPLGEVIQDQVGNLYGTTAMGGAYGAGTVFKIDPEGNETVLYSFSHPYNRSDDGDQPQGPLTLDSGGNLFGTTVLGGFYNLGTVFKIDPSGQENIVYTFSGGSTGAEFPYAGLLIDANGNYFGSTAGDGATSFGDVFELTSNGVFTALYTFTGGADGSQPMAGVRRDSEGNIYGTTKGGGAFGHGTVFMLSPNNQESVLYSFTGGVDGGEPRSSLSEDAKGNLYGTTIAGGAFAMGTIFKLDTTGHESVLHSFKGGSDGKFPYAGLDQDVEGNLYGTTTAGGNGYGTIFEITP
jgi:uncharacterized repeat protein (TIGR03803 family)